MRRKSISLTIIAIAAMLVAVSSGYAYTEKWVGNILSDGVHTSTITYDGTTYTYDHSEVAGGSYIYCWTYDAN